MNIENDEKNRNQSEDSFVTADILRVSYERLESTGLYLVENGHYMLLWIGTNVPQQMLKNLFDTTFLESIDVTQVCWIANYLLKNKINRK